MNHSLVQDIYELVGERREYMPENFGSSAIPEVEPNRLTDSKEELMRTWKFRTAPLWRLRTETKKYYTPKPLSVRIYREGDFFFAENENLAVCGTGETPEDALKDFCSHIIYFFNYYKKLDASRLTGNALKLKELYKNLLIEQ